jgi:FHA domain
MASKDRIDLSADTDAGDRPDRFATVVSSDAAPTTVSTNPLAPTAWLIVVRGIHPKVEYPLRPGTNLIGRAWPDVDIDLIDQELPDLALASRRHAVVRVEGDKISIEDLASLNGTLVNRAKATPGEQITLKSGDVLQIGTVLLQLEC